MTSGTSTSWLRSRRGRQLGIGLVAGALVASGMVMATALASPASAASGIQPVGTIELSSRNGATTATLNGTTQSFTTSGQCQLASSGFTLLRFAGKVGQADSAVGFQGGTFGVAEKPSGTSCVEINNNKQTASEALSIRFGTGGTPFPLVATSATLDIEAKGTGAKTTIVLVAADGTEESKTLDCNSTTSDSGPDAKSGDNCVKASIKRTDNKPFVEMRISASAGAAISLEGGQDWVGSPTPNVKSTFDVGYFGDFLDCNSSTVTVTGSLGIPTAQVRNVGVSSGTCTGFIYSLTNTGGTATFLKPYSEQSQRLQFIMDLTWQITDGAVAELPKVFFGFHNVNLQPGTARELGWCANPTFTNGLASGLATVPTSAMDVEPDNTLFPGVQYACVASSDIKRDGSGKPIAWVQSVYVHGDAYARR